MRAEFQIKDGVYVAIEAEDLILIAEFKWKLGPYGEVLSDSRKGQPSIFLHRLITNAPKGKIVHHIDGNRLNNTRSNLVVISQAEHASVHSWAYQRGVTIDKYPNPPWQTKL